MKKILFLLLVTTASYSQALFDKGIKVTGGITTDNTATKVVVQSANNVLNTILKDNLIDVVIVNTTAELTSGIGNIAKLYATRDNTIIYRYNGTVYVALGGDNSNNVKLTGNQFKTGNLFFTNNLSTPSKLVVNSNANATDSGFEVNGASSIPSAKISTLNGTALSVISTGFGTKGIVIEPTQNNPTNGNMLILSNKLAGNGAVDTSTPLLVLRNNVTVASISDLGATTATSFIKSSAPSTNLLLAGGGDIAQSSFIGGSGTTNFLPKFTASGTVGNSIVSDDGTAVMISKTGTTSLNIQTNSTGSPSLFLTAGGSDGMSITYDRATSEIRFSNSGATNAFKISAAGLLTSSSLSGTGQRIVTANASGQLSATTIPVFADNTAAIAGGLGVGALYRTVIGLLAVVF